MPSRRQPAPANRVTCRTKSGVEMCPSDRGWGGVFLLMTLRREDPHPIARAIDLPLSGGGTGAPGQSNQS